MYFWGLTVETVITISLFWRLVYLLITPLTLVTRLWSYLVNAMVSHVTKVIFKQSFG